MTPSTLRKLQDISLHLRLAAMALENEEGVEVDDVNAHLDELDEILTDFEVGELAASERSGDGNG